MSTVQGFARVMAQAVNAVFSPGCADRRHRYACPIMQSLNTSDRSVHNIFTARKQGSRGKRRSPASVRAGLDTMKREASSQRGGNGKWEATITTRRLCRRRRYDFDRQLTGPRPTWTVLYRASQTGKYGKLSRGALSQQPASGNYCRS